MRNLSVYTTALLLTFCPVAGARAPLTKSVVVHLADGGHIAFSRCAIAAFLTADIAREAECSSIQDFTACSLPSGNATVSTVWQGADAGVYLGTVTVEKPALIGRMVMRSTVSAELKRGLAHDAAVDTCEVELGPDQILRVKWTAGE